MNRRSYTWRVSLVGSDGSTKEVEFTTYWSPTWPTPERAWEYVASAAAATASVATGRKVIYQGVAAERVEPEPAAA